MLTRTCLSLDRHSQSASSSGLGPRLHAQCPRSLVHPNNALCSVLQSTITDFVQDNLQPVLSKSQLCVDASESTTRLPCEPQIDTLTLQELLTEPLPASSHSEEVELPIALQSHLKGDWRLAGDPNTRFRWAPVTDSALRYVPGFMVLDSDRPLL